MKTTTTADFKAKLAQGDQTAQVEAALAGLIAAHGIAEVQRGIRALLPEARVSDWQRLDNLARNVDRRMRREKHYPDWYRETCPKCGNPTYPNTSRRTADNKYICHDCAYREEAR